MFGVPKPMGYKMIIKSNSVLQQTFINFYKPQFWTGSTKNLKMTKMSNFGLKTPENDLFTLN